MKITMEITIYMVYDRRKNRAYWFPKLNNKCFKTAQRIANRNGKPQIITKSTSFYMTPEELACAFLDPDHMWEARSRDAYTANPIKK